MNKPVDNNGIINWIKQNSVKCDISLSVGCCLGSVSGGLVPKQSCISNWGECNDIKSEWKQGGQCNPIGNCVIPTEEISPNECKIEYNRKWIPSDYWFTFINGNWYYGTVNLIGELSISKNIIDKDTKIEKEYYKNIIFGLFNNKDYDIGLDVLVGDAKSNSNQLILHKNSEELKLEGNSLTVDNIKKFCISIHEE